MTYGRAALILTLVAAVMWLGLSPAATESSSTVRARLTGFEEFPLTLFSEASGSFVARVNDSIEYTLSYEGFTSGVLFAHIHFGRRGVAGGIVAFLCGGGGKPPCPSFGGTVIGTIVAADIRGLGSQGFPAGDFDALVRAIVNGAAYVNVHSIRFPVGEIRGQIRGKDFHRTEP